MEKNEIINTINERISDYLTFDIYKLLNINGLYIYGGALRDSITNEEYHDIDILLPIEHYDYLKKFLYENGYKNVREELFKKGISKHKNDSTNLEYYKIYGGIRRIIQIHPSTYENHDPDFSVNSLYYSKNGLVEKLDDAILHCELMVFKKNPRKKVKDFRFNKLTDLGWKYCDEKVERQILKIKNKINE